MNHLAISMQVRDGFAALEREKARLREQNDELRERIRQLEESMVDKASIPRALGLTRSQERLLGFLLKREFASWESMSAALFSASVAEPLSGNLICVMICKIRQKLKPFGIKIETSWGRGYFLKPETKAKIRAMQEGNHV